MTFGNLIPLKMNMTAEQTTCEDLKAFERRLTEIITCVQPVTRRWRVSLVLVFISVSVGAYYWLRDPDLYKISFFYSLLLHPLFSISASILAILLLMGAHRKIMAPAIIASRARSVLIEFNMSCDDSGKLILRPRHID